MKLQDYRLTSDIETKILIGIKNSSNYGISCLFVPIDARVGVKLFPRKYDRDFSLKWQKKLNEEGLTPAAGRAFIFKFDWPVIYDDAPDGIDELQFDTLMLYSFFTQRANTNFKNKEKAISFLYQKAINRGFRWEDAHSNNIGMIGKKYVIIDTDPVSMSESY